MKFGKQIQAQQIPGWSPYYVDYKGLKKIINSLAKNRPLDAVALAAGMRPAHFSPSPQGSVSGLTDSVVTPDLSNGAATFSGQPPTPRAAPNGLEDHQLVPESTESSLLQAHKAAFFFKLERELEKINVFYLQKEAELKVRLRSLIDKRKAIQAASGGKLNRGSSSFVALHEGFRHFEKDLSKLQQFIEINATGFRKILKKWDKRSKSTTKELYLARQVEIQPCFNREFIAELSDAATANILKLESLLHDADGLPTDSDPAADGIASDRPRMTLTPGTGVEDGFEDLETELSKAIASQSQESVKEILDVLPTNAAAGPTGRMRIARILWRAALQIDAQPTEPSPNQVVQNLIPTSLLDFDFVDDINGRTCLHESAAFGRLDLVKLCLAKGVSQGSKDVYGRQALHYSAMNGHAAVCDHLVSVSASPYELDLDGYSSIAYAISNGRLACVQAFLKHGVDFEPKPGSELIPLSMACQYGHEAIVLLLLQRSKRLQPDAAGFYPQHLAAREGHAAVLQVLVDTGADVDITDKYSQWTPLFHAASEGHASCVEVLLKARCNIQALDEFGKAPIHYAAWQGHVDCINLLLQAGAQRGPNGSAQASSSSNNAIGSASSDGQDPMDLDADLIPSLSLPPPIMPLRIYGHNYLDKKALVQVSLGHPNTSKASILSPVRLYNQSQLSSLKLVISSKPDSMAIPHSVILPLTDEREVFSFQIESFDVLSLEFDLFPTFGSKVIGKAVAFPSTFSDLQSQGHYVIPLLDPHLKVIGEIAFEVNVVKPFEGVQLEVGGRMETYWKSTNPVTAPDTGLMPAPLGLNPGPAGSSVVTASSLTGEHVRIVVQVTNDGVPVVYPSWNLPIDGFELRVSDISFAQFEALAVRKGKTLASKITAKTQEPSEWYRAISESLVGLSEVLAVTPTSVGVDLEIRYPTLSDVRRLGLHSAMEINSFVDAILKTVYETPSARSGSIAKHRRIVFSSFNPVVCTALNWKQPNYAVFFASYCGLSRSSSEGNLLPANRTEDDRRCTSLREAVKFARGNNLLGVMFDSTILAQVPTLIHDIKDYGLLLTTFGVESRDVLLKHGADAHLADGVLSYQSREFSLAVDSS